MTSWPSFDLAPRDCLWGKAAFADGILQIMIGVSSNTILTSYFHATGKSALLTFLAQLEARKIRALIREVEIKIFKWLDILNKHLICWASPTADIFQIFPFISSDNFLQQQTSTTMHAVNTTIQIKWRDSNYHFLTCKAQWRRSYLGNHSNFLAFSLG